MATSIAKGNRARRKKRGAGGSEVFRVVQAPLARYPKGHRRGQIYQALFERLGDLARRANAEASALIKGALRVRRNENNQLEEALLVFPCASTEAADEAREYLQNKDETKPYANSYRLVGMETRPGLLPLLHFQIAKGDWQMVKFKGEETKKRIWRVDAIPAEFLQMLICAWLRPPLLVQLPTACRQGLAQEVSQQTLSHLGLNIRDREKVGFPDLDGREVAEVDDDWRTLISSVATSLETPTEEASKALLGYRFPKPQTIRFIAADSAIVWMRHWTERHKIRRGHGDDAFDEVSMAGHYVYLPIFVGLPANSPLHQFAEMDELFWWHDCLEQFTPLKRWSTIVKTKTIRKEKHQVVVDRQLVKGDRGGLLVPLDSQSRSVDNLLIKLGDSSLAVCWSLLVKEKYWRHCSGRPPVWLMQFTCRVRVAAPLPRPNLLGFCFRRQKAEPQVGRPIISSLIDWVLVREGQVSARGNILVDQIPDQATRSGHYWRDQRQTATEMAALKLVQLAIDSDANLTAEYLEQKFVPKQTKNPTANRDATRWNYSAIDDAIVRRGEVLPEPISLACRVPSSALEEVPLDQRAEKIALWAWQKLQTK